MVNLVGLQNRINASIFDNLGSTMVVSSLLAPSIDKYGDESSSTWSTARTIVAVPYNLFSNRNDYQAFGNLNVGEVDIAFKNDQSLVLGMRALWSGNYYVIKNIEEFPIKDGNLVKVARLAKSII